MCKNNPLFTAYRLNPHIELRNRVIMAPMTQCKALRGLVPNPIMASYYAQRAQAGLIISEATLVCKNGQGYPYTPGMYTRAQIDGWKHITDKVHEAGGKIFAQLWHAGRAAHPIYINDERPVAPSSIAINRRLPRTNLTYVKPRELSADEISCYVEYFANAAYNAMQAGFDGIEIHGANGYLIDQFLHSDSNQRTDKYGGTNEGKCRFLLEILDTTINIVGSEHVGVRLSPGAFILGIEKNAEDADVFKHLLSEIDDRNIAYVHSGITNDKDLTFDYLGGRVSSFMRKHYRGNLIVNGGYTPAEAKKAIENNETDLVAFARLFLANPNLVEKIKNDEHLTAYVKDKQQLYNLE